MNNHAQNDHPNEDQALEGALPPADELQPAPEQPITRAKNIRQFTAGFLGWYLVMGLVFISLFPEVNLNSPSSDEGLIICSGLIFPIQLIGLILLFIKKEIRNLGWGILSALGVNLVISLLLGFATNAICFVPFFTPVSGF